MSRGRDHFDDPDSWPGLAAPADRALQAPQDAAPLVEGSDPYETTYSARAPFDPCVQLSSAMKLALEGDRATRVQLLARPQPGEGAKRRWSTGITGLDLHTGGGWHGFSGLVGDEGTGKSDLALRSAIHAAHPNEDSGGWEVYYVNGELDRYDLRERFARLATDLGDSYVEAAAEHLCVYHLSRGKTLGDIVRFLERDVLLRGARRAVVIFDTVDTIAAWSQEYLLGLQDIYLWAMGLRILVPDLASVLCVAEPNRDGRGKGRRLEKWSDFVVSMRASARNPGCVAFQVTKGRYSGRVDLLEWRHDWQRCAFDLVS